MHTIYVPIYFQFWWCNVKHNGIQWYSGEEENNWCLPICNDWSACKVAIIVIWIPLTTDVWFFLDSQFGTKYRLDFTLGTVAQNRKGVDTVEL